MHPLYFVRPFAAGRQPVPPMVVIVDRKVTFLLHRYVSFVRDGGAIHPESNDV